MRRAVAALIAMLPRRSTDGILASLDRTVARLDKHAQRSNTKAARHARKMDAHFSEAIAAGNVHAKLSDLLGR